GAGVDEPRPRPAAAAVRGRAVTPATGTGRNRGRRAGGGSRRRLRTRRWARSFLEYLFRDDELHDLARAFIDLGDLRVTVVTLRGEILQIAVSPEDLHAVARGFHRDVRCEELRLGGRENVVLARVL